MNLKTFAVLFMSLIALSGCVSNPKRPDAPMCGHLGDCINGSGEFQTDPRLLLCTDPIGYALYEDYIDQLELRIRQLERGQRRKGKESESREVEKPMDELVRPSREVTTEDHSAN